MIVERHSPSVTSKMARSSGTENGRRAGDAFCFTVSTNSAGSSASKPSRRAALNSILAALRSWLAVFAATLAAKSLR